MPYVATDSGWNIGAPALWDTIRLDRLYRPIGGTVPSGFVTVGALSASSLSYTNPVTRLWNSGLFNSQGQRWEAIDGTPANGCKNVATPRLAVNHLTEAEFLHTGGPLDIMFIGSSYHDIQVYVEYSGKLHKVAAAPITGTSTGLRYLPLTFAASFHGRIRVHLGGANFVGIRCEESAITKRSPDRPFAILDGGKWADAAGIKQASGTSYLVHGLGQLLFERTGIVFGNRATPSGFFYNGDATVTDDTAASDNNTRWFSTSRKSHLAADFAGKPLFYLLVGTTDDGGRSGATGGADGPMAARAKSCYDWIRARDRYCAIFHVSPLPFTGAGAAGTVTGPPTADSGHDLNRREQAAALATVPNSAYVNAFGPAAPWWTGAGSNSSPVTSQQATLIGADGINPNDVGMRFLAGKISSSLGQLLVNALRARRQR